jgi:hypothetical protein
MMGILEINIDQLPKISFSAMLVHLASKKLKKLHVEGPRQQFWTCTRFIALTILGTFVAGRCLAVVSRLATVLAAPVAGFYLMTTCPTNESFDAKKELKRVLRG